MTTLPRGWAIASLEDIAAINPRHPRDLEDSLPVTFVRMPALSENSMNFQFSEERVLGEVRKGFTHFAEGDVLFAKITPCMENGKAGVASRLINGVGCGTTELHVLRPHDGIDSKYIYYYIHRESFREEAARNFTGTAGQLRVPVDFMRGSEIPLPPVNEQRRIAAKLEQLLSRVDAAQARLATVPHILKRFRQSVLAAACSGRLTVDWRKKSSSVIMTLELFQQLKSKQKYSIDKDGLPELPKNWIYIPIGNIAEFQQGMQIAKKRRMRAPAQNRLPILRIGNYATQFKEDVDYVELDEDSLIAEPEDIILARTGETRGKVLTGYRGVFHNNTFRINYNQHFLMREYLITWLETDSVQSFIRQGSGRSAQPDLTHKAFGACPLALPPLREQQEIVRRVDALLRSADVLEARYQRARKNIDQLTQSILAKAFRGELVPQDSDDEPALVLLSKIRSRSQSGRHVNKTHILGEQTSCD